MKLHIGSTSAKGTPFNLPIELVTTSLAILAKKRVGKSYTTDVFAESLMEAGMPVGIIDITGAHWGLKSSADGKSVGFPMVVFGGDHADVPLEENAGAIVARAVIEHRFSFILDFSVMTKAGMKRFLIAFLEEFYRLNREPFHLICDEADRYAPQQPMGDEIRLVAAMDDIVSRGGIKGIGVSIVSQRSAKVNKNIVTQCELLVVLRTIHHLDAKTIMEWVEMHATKEEAAVMLKSLPTLPVGTAWFWWPGEGSANIFERVDVRRRTTFDSGATPKAGELRKQPKTLAQVDVTKLGKEIAATVERAKAEDPKTLRQEIARLNAELLKKPAAVTPERVEVPILTDEHDRALHHLLANSASLEPRISALLEEIQGFTSQVRDMRAELRGRIPPTQIPRTNQPKVIQSMPVRPKPSPINSKPVNGNASLGKCSRTLLTVLCQFHPKPCSKNRLALISGYSITSSGFSNALSELRVNGLIDGSPDLYPTEQGITQIGHYDPMPEGDAAVRHWIGKLGKCPSALLAAVHACGDRISKSDLADQTNYSITSSGFSNGLSELRVLGLIQSNSTEIWIAPEFTS